MGETGKIDTSKLNSDEPISLDPEFDVEKVEAGLIVNLRVRTETGKRNIILKMLATDTIAKVYDAVNPYSESSDSKFELRTNFPNKVYSRGDAKTLKELGL